jgi:hypothetical protein
VKMFLMLLISIILAGCSAAPRQVKETDFLTKHVFANAPVTDTYANWQQGLRYCGFEKYGFPDCTSPDKNGTVLCNTYPDRSAVGKTSLVSGKIQFASGSPGTKATLRVRKNISNNEDILMAWEIFMSGRVREACP